MPVFLITNDIPPYYQDVVNCLALPEGMVYRFRYERQPLDLVGNPNPKDLEGKAGMIVFRRWSTGKLVPIRSIRVLNVLATDFLIVIEFAMGHFLDGDHYAIGDSIARAIAPMARENRSNANLVPLVYEVDVDWGVESVDGAPYHMGVDSQINGWRSTIEAIKTFENISNAHFLYVVSLSRQDGKQPSDVAVNDHEYLLDADEAYDLRILQYMTESSDDQVKLRDARRAVAVTIMCDKDVILPIVDRCLIVGRYDQLRFSFRTSATRMGAGTVLQIGQPVKAARLEGRHHVASISLPLRINVGGWQLGLLTAGLMIFIFGPTVVTKTGISSLDLILGSGTQAVGALFALVARDPESRAKFRAFAKFSNELALKLKKQFQEMDSYGHQ